MKGSMHWRWMSPAGIQAVSVAASPALGRSSPVAMRPAAASPDGCGAHFTNSRQATAPGMPQISSAKTAGSGASCGGSSCSSFASRGTAQPGPSTNRSVATRSATAAATSSTSTRPVNRRRVAAGRTAADDVTHPGHLPASSTEKASKHPSTSRPPTFHSPTNPTPAATTWEPRSARLNPPTLARAQLQRPASSAEAVRRVAAAASASMSYSAAAGMASGSAAAAAVIAVPLPTRHIVAAVDPDLNGALALIHWDEDPDPAAASPPGADGQSALYDTGSSSPWRLAGRQGFWLLSAAGVGAEGGAREGGAAHEDAGDADDADDADGDHGDEEAGVEVGELWLPAPPAPPADPTRWSVHVWDMPVSATERKKRTASGQISRRRLLHVAGARAVLARALASALPPPGELRRVALYGYVEVPPILPGDGNIAAYTSLWSTGAWLGLLTGMGFTVGSTPVRRWKTDLGLYGARSKEAGLTLARTLFPSQARILRHKKNHGRADALLIAAWALGASLPPRLAGTLRRNGATVDQLLAEQPGVGLAWGPPRPPTPTDAYGNLLTPEQDMMDEIEAAQSKVERQDLARATRRSSKSSAAAEDSTTVRRRKKKNAAEAPPESAGEVADVVYGGNVGANNVGELGSVVGRGGRTLLARGGGVGRKKGKGAAEAPAAAAGEAPAGLTEGGGRQQPAPAADAAPAPAPAADAAPAPVPRRRARRAGVADAGQSPGDAARGMISADSAKGEGGEGAGKGAVRAEQGAADAVAGRAKRARTKK